MAVAFVRAHTGGVSTSSGTTVTFTTNAAGVDAGDLLVVGVSADNESGGMGPTISSIGKPGGESASWAVLIFGDGGGGGTAASTVVGSICAIKTTTAWPGSTAYTVTLSSAVTAKTTVAAEFSGVDNTVVGVAIGSGGVGVATSVTTLGTAPSAGDLAIGLIYLETNAAPTADSDTLNGSWNAGVTNNTASGGGAANAAARLQWKILTASGHQTFNKTQTTDGGAALVNLQAVPAPSISPAPLLRRQQAIHRASSY